MRQLTQEYTEISEFETLIFQDPECQELYSSLKNLHLKSEEFQQEIEGAFKNLSSKTMGDNDCFQECRKLVEEMQANEYVIDHSDFYISAVKDFEEWEEKAASLLSVREKSAKPANDGCCEEDSQKQI